MTFEVTVDDADTDSDPIGETLPSTAFASTLALAPPPTVKRVNVAPTPTAPMLACPDSSEKLRVAPAETLTSLAELTLPRLACVRLVSLMTTAPAPSPTKPVARSSATT